MREQPAGAEQATLAPLVARAISQLDRSQLVLCRSNGVMHALSELGIHRAEDLREMLVHAEGAGAVTARLLTCAPAELVEVDR